LWKYGESFEKKKVVTDYKLSEELKIYIYPISYNSILGWEPKVWRSGWLPWAEKN